MTSNTTILLMTLLMTARAVLGAEWADRGEYDLVLKIRAEASPQFRLKLLDEWKTKYPQSTLWQVRCELFLAAYESTNRREDMVQVAHELIQKTDSFTGLYWVTALTGLLPANADQLAAADSAAERLLRGLDRYMSVNQKQAWMKPEEWKARATAVALKEHRTRGWIALQRQDTNLAAAQFQSALELNRNDAQISAWLAVALSLSKDPANRIPALWQMARAASVRGDGALTESERRNMDQMLESAYVTFHGSPDGMDKLREMSQSNALPPPGFQLESAEAVRAREAEEELARMSPELAAWTRIRRHLESQDAVVWFGSSLQGRLLPRLKGTVIRSQPEERPSELVLALSGETKEEVVLRLPTRLTADVEPGTVIEFEGNAESFDHERVTLTVQAELKQVTGLPAASARRRR